MAEAMRESEHHRCYCDHGHFDLSTVASSLNEIRTETPNLADDTSTHNRNSILKNGCLKSKLAINGLKVSERCKDTCCHSESEVLHSYASANQDSCCVTQNRVPNNDPQEESVLCSTSSIESYSKTESDISDTVVSTSISELSSSDSSRDLLNGIEYVVYESEIQMPDIMRLITKDLSEPYSIYTYRYFIHNWPKLCFLAMDGDKCVGAIVCKLDLHKKMVRRGYIAMLAVDKDYRRRKIGSHLVMKAIRAMISDDCDEVVLETEITNKSALLLYENLGFVRDKRLFRYYLNGVDALRLKLWLR